MKSLPLWQRVDLAGHSVIEAAAGTGKTFTIEHLLARLLVEDPNLEIGRCVVVTYTEKAAGELKARVRDTLQVCLRKGLLGERSLPPATLTRLRHALENLDQACISTIHGFCNRVLREYAFENRQVFELELAGDEILARELAGIMRREWPEWYGDDLPRLLGRVLDGKLADWRRTLLEAARSLRPGFDLLRPGDDADEAAAMLRRTLRTLGERAAMAKERQGLITYEDMLLRVQKALAEDARGRGTGLLAALRRAFHVALVDEFQDTDPVQWEIFRRVFVEAGDAGHRLIVVGDPKQAIYGFRGADVNTYLRATEKLGKRWYLETCHRCVPELLEPLNRLFGAAAWFGTAAADPPAGGRGAGIHYRPVRAAVANPRVGMTEDRSGRACLNLVSLRSLRGDNVGLVRYRLAAWVAAEIERLLARAGDLRFLDPDTGAPRRLRPGDIAVLVEKHKYERLLVRQLARRGLPCTIYKQAGLYAGDEAAHLAAVLAVLAHPDDEAVLRRALLSRFFTLGLEQMRGHRLWANPELLELCNGWQELAARRDWPRLFDSLLHDTGLCLREARAPRGERRLSNFRQLCRDLARLAVERNLDARGLYRLLLQYRREQREVEEGGDILERESDSSMVQVMTMHAAKGLEFPVVFVVGGVDGVLRKHKLCRYHDPETGKRVLALAAGDKQEWETAKQRAMAEEIEERKRLFYVALTRARYKVFLPCDWEAGRGSNNWIQYFIQPALRQAGLIAGASAAGSVCLLDLDGSVQGDAPAPVVHAHAQQRSASKADAGASSPPLAPRTFPCARVPDLRHLSLRVDSFSGLLRSGYREQARVVFDFPGRMLDDEHAVTGLLPTAGAWRQRPDPGPLPPGNVSGQVFHDFLERLAGAGRQREGGGLDFGFPRVLPAPASAAADAGLRALVLQAMARHGLANRETAAGSLDTAGEIVRLAHNALAAEIMPGCRLCDLRPADRLAEVEFLLAGHAADGGETGDAEPATGFLKGFIDLVFRHRGKYFILDWKTNLLADYSPPGLRRAMAEAGYELQYRIYSLALVEWLRLAGCPRPEAVMGGVVYLFVRGLGTGPGHGIFLHRWQPADLERCQQAVRHSLQESAPDRETVP